MDVGNFHSRHGWWLGLMLAIFLSHIGPALSADDLLTSQLIDEAKMWQSKGRSDLAAQTWQRLLLGNPQHGDALVSLGMIEAKSGRLQAARVLHGRAVKLSKAPAGLERLSALIGNSVAEPHPSVKNEPVRTVTASTNAAPALPAHNAVRLPQARKNPTQNSALVLNKSKPQSAMTAAIPPIKRIPPAPLAQETLATSLVFPQVPAKRMAMRISDSEGQPVELKLSESLASRGEASAQASASVTHCMTKPCRLPVSKLNPTGAN